ncbi:hypothetical protein [Salinicola lusitanus]|uniref:hypothetical protein n=1 Tax=Salinicola lusitanus TaxID=1949085 RepID=UPI000DA157F2|nr:hypothetical protein [Salinicola lusitanus]
MSNTSRQLTYLEKAHAHMVYLRVVFFKWLIVVLGTIITLLSIALPVAFIYDNIRAPLLLTGFLMLMNLVIMVLGVLFVAHGLGRAATLRSTTDKLHGRLIEKRNTGSSGNGGGRFTTYTYFIDKTQLYWPPGAESIYKPLVDQQITVTVAMIDIRNRAKLSSLLNIIGIDKLKEKPLGMGVVLEFRKVIDIHSVLEKYGRYYLLRYQLQWAAGFGFFSALAFFLLTHSATGDWMSQKSHFTQAMIIFGYIFGSILTAAFVANKYPAVRKLLNPEYDSTPHKERLKGN